MRTHSLTRAQWITGLVVLLAIATTASAAAFMIKEQTQTQRITQRAATNTPQTASNVQAVRCDDGNILGYLAGGAAGGVLGHQVGKGSGKTAATIGGTLGGAYLGGQHLPLRGTTCAN